MATVPVQPQDSRSSTAPLSQTARIVDTFIAPTKTFTDLRRSASWWAPFLIIVIVSVVFSSVVDQKVGFRKVVETQIELKPKAAERMEQMAAEQREKVMQQQVGLTKIITYAIPVIALLVYLVYAGVLFATLKFGASAEMKFSAMFALVVYSRLPEVLRALLTILSLLAGVSSDAFNIENPVATNPGYFIDLNGSAVLRALLTPLDVLTIWSLVLVAIGIPCISNVKRGTAFAVVFGWFALVVLVRAGLAAAF
jgi:Yip1 domain